MNGSLPPGLIKQAEYARRRGVAKSAVARAVKEGRITLIDGLVDPALADEQWAANTRARPDSGRSVSPPATPPSPPATPPSPPATPPSPPAPLDLPVAATPEPGYMQFRACREKAYAQIAEMNAAEMRGLMVMRDDVDRAVFENARELRDRLSGCARRIASEVAALATAEACEAVIDREHRIVLELLATGLREKLGAPAKVSA